MKIPGPLVDATFIHRPNRFLTLIKIGNTVVESHLPDPGRLKELLIPNAQLKVRQVNNRQTPARKTKWTTVLVKSGNQWISIDSTLPNRFVKWMLENKKLPILCDYRVVQQEVKMGHHRFDFLLEREGTPLYLEVKSVTLVKDGVAMFPDAVTLRGTQHVNSLSELTKRGVNTGVLFVCQRSDVVKFRPQWDCDPQFSKALMKAEVTGVNIWVISSDVTPTTIQFRREIPYTLNRC